MSVDDEEEGEKDINNGVGFIIAIVIPYQNQYLGIPIEERRCDFSM